MKNEKIALKPCYIRIENNFQLVQLSESFANLMPFFKGDKQNLSRKIILK